MEEAVSPEIRRRPIPVLVQDADQEEESEEEIQMLSSGPPPVPPDNSLTQRHLMPPISYQHPQARMSHNTPVGAGPSVEMSASNPSSLGHARMSLSPPEGAGPSVEMSVSNTPPSSQARISPTPPEGAGPSVEVNASNQPAMGEPNTQAATSSNTPEDKPKDAAAACMCHECEDGQVCPICFQPWSNMGAHRLASLKCGHLFGFECISKWLDGFSTKGRCPECNLDAVKSDIRIIYSKSIIVLDTTEKERLAMELKKEKVEKAKLEVEHAQTKLKYKLQTEIVLKLQEELRVLKTSAHKAEHSGMSCSSSLDKTLVYNMHLDVCQSGSCRVMAYNEWLGMLVVSMPSQVRMFPGYGIKKINLQEAKVLEYVPLHQNQIRDLAFNPAKQDLLLSVGLDQVIKVTNVRSNVCVIRYHAPAPCWCCCWSTYQPSIFYVGTNNGYIQQYDNRCTEKAVATFKLPGFGPLVSMTYINPGPESSLTCRGLLIARLQSCYFYEVETLDEAKSHLLPITGTFTSVSSKAGACHVLVSCRPSKMHPHARHCVYLLQHVDAATEGGSEGGRVVTAQLVHTFLGGTTQGVLTRSLLTCHPHQGSDPLVFAGDESNQSIYVWDLSTMTCRQKIQNTGTVVDLLDVTVGQNSYLVALTEKRVTLFNWASQ